MKSKNMGDLYGFKTSSKLLKFLRQYGRVTTILESQWTQRHYSMLQFHHDSQYIVMGPSMHSQRLALAALYNEVREEFWMECLNEEVYQRENPS